MKRIFLALLLAVAPLTVIGCKTPPSERVVAVQTLKAVGHSAEASVALAAQLRNAGKITPTQLAAVAAFYDQNFAPAFRLAVTAVNANLASPASSDLLAIASQLAQLVAAFQK